jgi:DNA primase
VNPKRVKYWYRGVGALPFNVDSMKFTNWAVLTEGPVDAIMCVQNGIPAMASSVGAGHFNLGWLNELQSLEVLYAVFDNDAGGLAGLNRVGKALGYFVRGYTFEGFEEGYDVTQFFKDGHTKDDFLKLLQEESKVI